MNEVPKIVHHRLRAATPDREVLERAHPNADVLTAFAEQALVASEREGVLQHLALCADCRDVVALALPEIQTATPPMEVVETAAVATHKTNRLPWESLSWAHLRWATLAAGIAVAIFVVRPGLERLGHPHTPANSAANQVRVAQPESPTQVGSSEVSSSPQPGNSAASLADKNVAPRPTEARGDSAARKIGSTASQAEMQLAGNRPLVAGNVNQSGRAKKDSFVPGMRAAPEYGVSSAAGNLQADKSSVSESTAGNSFTTDEAASGADVVSTEEASPSEPSLIARASGPKVQSAPKIEKAKPALDETTRDAAITGAGNEPQSFASSQAETTQAEVLSKATANMKAASAPAAMPSQILSWKIADGNLQRSLDGGHSWQIAARAPLALLCYANRGQDVWAGGHSGALLHSADNGATWNAVAVSSNGQSLSSDVVNLSLLGPAQIVLSTGTHESWSSFDGGKTWEKK